MTYCRVQFQRQASIHAPAQGATEAKATQSPPKDAASHAPAQGATIHDEVAQGQGRFNPRPRAGGDGWDVVRMEDAHGFNPRPRAGGDSHLQAWMEMRTGFNPRPRAGGDRNHGAGPGHGQASIHAPAQGATAEVERLTGERELQSTPPRRGRLKAALGQAGRGRFNPRPRAGGD